MKASSVASLSLLGLLSFAQAETRKEIASSRGLVQMTIRPMAAAAPDSEPRSADSLPGVTAAAAPDPSAIESIRDFTSLSEVVREGDALLEIHFLDKATGEELRFPLRYAQLRGYLLERFLDYQAGTPEERSVALIADLAGSFRIRMQEAAWPGDKP